ncbi:spectinomycin phosphotransferase [Actinoplanes lutulentus]|uniref:phosphotransferase n=1 Tax=Actinoplanes lutulentus TaxID=1287878 RepID=UPI0017ECAD54|nr:aminoglycoside phosphotransferase family protein [Actinoplanes lutulentus]MBB2946833.1 spectinomycin phosphotransferase [Actinoplanes lutulentus]
MAQRWFVKVDDLGFAPEGREAELDRIRRSLLTAVSLRDDSGLDFVLAPIPDETGAVIRRLSPRYALSLYPLLEGVSGPFAPHPPADRREIAELLARLHTANPLPGSDPYTIAPRLDLGVPGRKKIDMALSELDRPWNAGPYSAEARTLLAARADDVRQWLTDCDRLAADQPQHWVLTHGEPHPGNFLRTGDGRFLIDWNTVAIAPPERDLWMLTSRFADLVGEPPDGDDREVLRHYEELTGLTITDPALNLYPIRWALFDIAIFVDELRRGENLPDSLTYLRGYLHPTTP